MRPQTLHETDPAFTAWVGQTLHDTFDPVSEEPLPADMAELVRLLERIPPGGRQ